MEKISVIYKNAERISFAIGLFVSYLLVAAIWSDDVLKNVLAIGAIFPFVTFVTVLIGAFLAELFRASWQSAKFFRYFRSQSFLKYRENRGYDEPLKTKMGVFFYLRILSDEFMRSYTTKTWAGCEVYYLPWKEKKYFEDLYEEEA